ncbi:rod shape-determining protein MreD [Candidatus Falkowbacteria bacterium]|nr:rod shape-determining protein MreD [Candidatus Falkowbacteria bacterium]
MKKFERAGLIFEVFGKALAIVLLVLFQASFIAALPWPANYFNLVLSILIFITVILNFRQALWFALFSGLILDLFSFSNFGTLAITLLLVTSILNVLFRNFFTNRSFYSLIILGLIGNLIYIFLLLIFNFLFFVLGAAENLEKFSSRSNIFGFGWQIIFSISFSAILFLAFNSLGKKLKSVFIDAG